MSYINRKVFNHDALINILNYNDVSKQLRKARDDNNFTKEYVSQETGINLASLKKYESGDVKNIPPFVVEILAKFYNKSLSFFYGWSKIPLFTTMTGILIGTINGFNPIILLSSITISSIAGINLKNIIINFLKKIHDYNSFNETFKSLSDDEKSEYTDVKNYIFRIWKTKNIFSKEEYFYEESFLFSYYLSHKLKKYMVTLNESNNIITEDSINDDYSYLWTYKKIGEKIKVARSSKELSTNSICEQLEISPKLLYQYEGGKILKWGSSITNKFATLFGKLPEYFQGINSIPLLGTYTGLILMALNGVDITPFNLAGGISTSAISLFLFNNFISSEKKDIYKKFDDENKKNYSVGKTAIYTGWGTESLFKKEEIEQDEYILLSMFIAHMIKKSNNNNS